MPAPSHRRTERLETWQRMGWIKPAICPKHGLQYDGLVLVPEDRTNLHRPDRYCEQCIIDLVKVGLSCLT